MWYIIRLCDIDSSCVLLTHNLLWCPLKLWCRPHTLCGVNSHSVVLTLWYRLTLCGVNNRWCWLTICGFDSTCVVLTQTLECQLKRCGVDSHSVVLTHTLFGVDSNTVVLTHTMWSWLKLCGAKSNYMYMWCRLNLCPGVISPTRK